MGRERDDRGRFVKGNKEGCKFEAGGKQAEVARQGGIASGESKRAAKTLGEALRRIMDEPASAGSDKTRRWAISEKAIANLYNNPTMKDMKIAGAQMGELEQNINLNHNLVEKPVINIIPRKQQKGGE